ncbi:hypothetical protein J7G27_002583 [Vibrio vulnificus]|uniref:HD domain-containing protein n=1 Tax=Vibrio vulnificus TaxID=672 RepID=UPI001029E276|nr:hypothetical protein [Vibrio vulnificus]EHH1226311.1 hypothetical protein [Vibrio vulnificus]ELX4133045.1 hypothetical protein [Vibrio vulnificus]ELX4178094.1 hypothetical protein [Vibrio vulnificus]MDK2638745.1 hypothetical protein [Vibrio vulnificus]MDK2647102.1 hypothetical protein [Vibrio vulnificus]
MNLNSDELQPLEEWLKIKALETTCFPSGKNDYFDRYWQIKSYLAQHVYPYIAAGTSAEDGGVYTDHSLDHFNSVIRYAGELLGLEKESVSAESKINLKPYEVFITLVSILLHDAGNINGRRGHETQALKIFTGMGDALCPDQFEAAPIAKIARAHGGKVRVGEKESKDTIESLRLKDKDSYHGITFRPKLIAALVRFADEICEDRSRAARFLLNNENLPTKSEVFHKYASSISSVDVDLADRSIKIKFEMFKEDVIRTFGKDNGSNHDNVFLIDEINERLEKMFCELHYCKKYMYELSHIHRIKVNIEIYDEDFEPLDECKAFVLEDLGYPNSSYSFEESHPDWCGSKICEKLSNNGEAA